MARYLDCDAVVARTGLGLARIIAVDLQRLLSGSHQVPLQLHFLAAVPVCVCVCMYVHVRARVTGRAPLCTSETHGSLGTYMSTEISGGTEIDSAASSEFSTNSRTVVKSDLPGCTSRPSAGWERRG